MSTQNLSIHAIRQDYTKSSLNETQIDAQPLRQFVKWFEEALRSEVMEPNAMTLSTVSFEGQPSSRIVLLKEVDEVGFHFFTNYNSRKGNELMENPKVSLLFFWPELQRQVRIEGVVQKLPKEASDRYFHSRPKESRLGAIASPQSQVIEGRDVLEQNMEALQQTYIDTNLVPRPTHWGGYLVVPHTIEFWQGRSNRLHDRLRYQIEAGAWTIQRLAP
jgi:pyridoxamine 5'-phosphate oxidase